MVKILKDRKIRAVFKDRQRGHYQESYIIAVRVTLGRNAAFAPCQITLVVRGADKRYKFHLYSVALMTNFAYETAFVFSPRFYLCVCSIRLL